MSTTPERRYTPDPGRVRVKRAEGTEVIVGYAAVFYDGTPGTEYLLYDGMVEHIDPHAFDEAITRDDCRALFNHHPDNILGRTKAGTLRLLVDARGLKYIIKPADSQATRDLMEHIRRGDISGSSFGFDITEKLTDYGNDGNMIVTVTKARLYDVGPVTYPAYEGTAAGLGEGDGSLRAAPARPSRGPSAAEIAARLAEMEKVLGRRDPREQAADAERTVRLAEIELYMAGKKIGL